MNKFFVLMAVCAIVCSCSKDEMQIEVEPGMESVLYLSLSTDQGTKASGTGHGKQEDDNTIQYLEVFVFRVSEGNPDDGVLDGYRKFTSSELGTLKNLEVQTTTGKKMIYAVANSHRINWKGINTRASFEEQLTHLKDEDAKNFIMTGTAEAQVQLASTVSLIIKRMVARVEIKSVKTAFAGGPYEGLPLTDVKAYLINVQGTKYIYNGSGDNFSILNNGENLETDSQACVMKGMLADNLSNTIYDDGYNTSHYFYCYENKLETENGGNKFTRLVIEGKLNGVTYYYPIPIKGIERNTCYSLDVTIKRPGSLLPEADVEKGTLLATLFIKGWQEIDNGNIEF